LQVRCLGFYGRDIFLSYDNNLFWTIADSITHEITNNQTFITWHHVKIIAPPMIGVDSIASHCFDFNGPFMQVFYISFLIVEATSPLFFLW
jgi:hypothetical protein